MAINIDPAQLTALVQKSEEAARIDALYHDQHGDSLKWDAFEWESYHRAIARALGLDPNA